jgi:hypothetical protein
VNGGQLTPAGDGPYLAWMFPPASDREPNPPYGYVISLVRLHERGFNTPASRFMRGLCHHYEVELHNFAPNAISQAACFVVVVVCEGFLGVPENWTYGSISSAASSILSAQVRGGHAGRSAPTATRSCCGTRARSYTCRVP